MGAARDPKEQQAAASPQRETGERKDLERRDGNHQPRRFVRVPTHAIGVAHERRCCPRAALCLPLRLTQVAGRTEPIAITLVTCNISSSGVYFLAPRWIEPGTAIEMEVALIERPLGQGSVHMRTAAHIVRSEQADTSGWRGYAATFDDIVFSRDDNLPMRDRSA